MPSIGIDRLRVHAQGVHDRVGIGQLVRICDVRRGIRAMRVLHCGILTSLEDMMKRLLGPAFALAMVLGLTAPLQAQTLRWASQGDAQTMDPHSQNELLTNAMNGQVYETLINRDKQLGLEPVLATEWQQVSPLLWRFKLRPNVKFHDGTPFTADDVVFSVLRAREGTSDIRVYASAVGEPRKVDNLTVEFVLKDVNPIFLQHLGTLQIMSKVWCEKNRAVRPQDFKNKEETFTALNANGTGPFVLVSRAPDTKTVYKRNPAWWGKFDGNVQEVVYTPIKSDATRTAALISGEIDFVLDPVPQDVPRLRNTPGVKVIDGPENRVVFIGMDQDRDKLLYGNVPGDKNPFKDLRVRRALYQAIDIETIRSRLMRGQAFPTGGITPSPLGAFNDPEIEKRLPYDLDAAKKLMIEAGYPQGFEVTLDCPNNRYINDEEICQTLAATWARLERQGPRQRHAAFHLLPQDPEVRHIDVHAGLGRLDHRRRDHAHAGAAQPRRRRRGHLEHGGLQGREVRRAGCGLEQGSRSQEARAAHQGRSQAAQRPGAAPAAAPPGDPLGGPQQCRRGAPRRQLARVALGDGEIA